MEQEEGEQVRGGSDLAQLLVGGGGADTVVGASRRGRQPSAGARLRRQLQGSEKRGGVAAAEAEERTAAQRSGWTLSPLCRALEAGEIGIRIRDAETAPLMRKEYLGCFALENVRSSTDGRHSSASVAAESYANRGSRTTR